MALPVTVLPANEIPHPTLVQDVPVGTSEERAAAFQQARLLEHVCRSEGGVGLAAVQLGLPHRAFVVVSDGTQGFAAEGKCGYFVNCTYQATPDTEGVASVEGCLSIRDEAGRIRQFRVPRFSRVQVTGLQLVLHGREVLARPFEATVTLQEQGAVFQHEIDHQYGVLISDIGTEIQLVRLSPPAR